MNRSRLPPTGIQGEVPPWRRPEILLIVGLAVATLILRAWDLSADGFADDEIHKWLAANRYLHGDFGGDDVEHPMVMKALIALAIAVFPRGVAPETLTRIPNVVAGAVSVWALAQLGRRLFGKGAALIAATIYALSPLAIGYGRIAKEDTLYTLFLMLFFWCLTSACASADDGRDEASRRWEKRAAMCMGAMFASKYQIFVVPLLPVVYFWLTRGSRWRLSIRRLVTLAAISAGTLLVLDWVILLPSTWSYLLQYLGGAPTSQTGDRATSESILFMGRLYDNLGLHMLTSPPLWFFAVFAGTKLAPPTVLLVCVGLGLALWQRRPAHGLLLLWMGVFLLIYFVMGVKYGRYFIPLFPPVALLAGHAAATLADRLRAVRPSFVPSALAMLVLVVAVPEATATVSHLPHPRLYINAFGGGDANVDFLFPHCDYFDSGLREAIQAVAARAEPNAEISAEPGWVVRYYADAVGRHDITETTIRPSVACTHGHVCYVIAQTGRLYWHNEQALNRLAARAPWTTIDVGGHKVIRVYRLEPGESLFPPPAEVPAVKS